MAPLGIPLLIAGFAAVAASAWLGAASLRLRGAVEFLLAVYLFSSGGIVVIVLGRWTAYFVDLVRTFGAGAGR